MLSSSFILAGLRRLTLYALSAVILGVALTPAAQAGASEDPPVPEDAAVKETLEAARVIHPLPPLDTLDLPHAIIEGVTATPERADAHWVSGAGLSRFSQMLAEGAMSLQAAFPQLPVQWNVTAAGGDFLGERLSVGALDERGDGPDFADSATWFVNTASGEAFSSRDLLAPQAEPTLSQHLSVALTQAAAAGARIRTPLPPPAGPYDDLSFAPDGSLIVTVPGHQYGLGPFLTVRLAPEAANGLLSPIGVTIRQAISRSSHAPQFYAYPLAASPNTGGSAPLIGDAPTEDIDCAYARCVALTFDDGPDPRLTPELLDVLFRERVHATFFVQGSAGVQHQRLLVRALREGHTLGTHTWSHPRLPFLSPEQVYQEVVSTKDLVVSATGRTPILMRPPYGEFSTPVLNVLQSTGDAAIMWNVDTEDWKNKSVPETTRRAIEGSQPGSIILMHDVHPTTIQSVPGIIRGLRERGFSLVSVPTLLGPTTPGDVYYGRS